MSVETEQERADRHRRRSRFDSVASLYDATRRGYPEEIVDFMAATAELGPASEVLEIGCGTGQLTRQLACHDVALTAIDIGARLVDLARQHVEGTSTQFEVTAFEDFERPPDTFDLVVSATAFHWIDPDVAWSKTARQLRPGGWLAVLSTGEQYEDPFGAALLALWIGHSSDGGAWSRETKPTVAELMVESGCFDTPIVRTHSEQRTLPSEAVIGLEQTRATSLSYDEPVRRSFEEHLRDLLAPTTEVRLQQATSLTMARALPGV